MRTVVMLALAACGTYEAGSFRAPRPSRELPGTHLAFGCVDVAVAFDRGGEAAAVVEYWVGNGCDRRATIDLSAARVVATTATGEQIELAARDRYHRLHAYAVGARDVGALAVEYVDPRGTPAVELVDLCVDARALVPGVDPPRGALAVCSGSRRTTSGTPTAVVGSRARCAVPPLLDSSDERCLARASYTTRDPFALEVGGIAMRLPAPSLDTASGATALSSGGVVAFGAHARVHAFYLPLLPRDAGLELDVLNGAGPILAIGSANAPSRVHVLRFAFVVGTARSIGRVSLGGEVALGFRDETVEAVGMRDVASTTRLHISPRVRLATWATPRVSVDIMGEADVASWGDAAVIGALVFHGMPFDGR
jgi:hypothetical protein